MSLSRILEPEVMASVQEAVEYDHMDHSTVNQLFVDDMLTVLRATRQHPNELQNLQIVDIGCGTLQIPLRLVQTWPECGPVSACDLSFAMLQIGMQNVSKAGLDGRILPLFCDARRLPVADASIDVIMSNSIIHHIPDPLSVLQEIRRCIRSPGLIFIRDLLRPETEQRLDWIVRTYAEHESEHARQMFRDSLHAALTLDEIRQLLSQADLNPDSVQQTSDRHWTVSCVV